MAHSQILSESTFFPIEPTPTHTNLSIHPDTLIDDKKGEAEKGAQATGDGGTGGGGYRGTGEGASNLRHLVRGFRVTTLVCIRIKTSTLAYVDSMTRHGRIGRFYV